MGFTGRLVKSYFNLVYNPAYDFTTGRLSRYQRLQAECIDRLDIRDNGRLLCVGVGTGNEINRILERDGNVSLTGVDYSEAALLRARRKALGFGSRVELFQMDAHYLEFPSETFDRVLCLHVMDFLGDQPKATGEIVRVLKKSGKFVITYPSDSEGVGLGLNLFRDSIKSHVASGKNRVTATLIVLVQVLVGMVYLPLLLRPKKKPCSREELASIFARLGVKDLLVEEEPVYCDFIVCGQK